MSGPAAVQEETVAGADMGQEMCNMFLQVWGENPYFMVSKHPADGTSGPDWAVIGMPEADVSHNQVVPVGTCRALPRCMVYFPCIEDARHTSCSQRATGVFIHHVLHRRCAATIRRWCDRRDPGASQRGRFCPGLGDLTGSPPPQLASARTTAPTSARSRVRAWHLHFCSNPELRAWAPVQA